MPLSPLFLRPSPGQPRPLLFAGPKARVKCLVWALFLFYFLMLTIGLELWPMATVYTRALHGFCSSSNSISNSNSNRSHINSSGSGTWVHLLLRATFRWIFASTPSTRTTLRCAHNSQLSEF